VNSRFELPLLIIIKPSPWMSSVLIFIHIGAAAALLAVDLHSIAISAVLMAIAASLAHALVTVVGQKHPDTPVQLLLTAGEEWWLTCVSGHTFQARLLPVACVHPLLTVMSFGARGRRRYSVILTPDVVDGDLLRRLRVRLRFQHDREPG